MLTGKELVFVSGASVLVFAAGVGAQSVRGIMHERDVYKALAQLPHEPLPAPSQPSAQPTATAAGPAPSSSPPAAAPKPRQQVLQVVSRSAPAAASQVPVPAPSSPAPPPASSRPTSPPTRCPVAAVATVRLPVGVLPCSTVVVGGAGR